LKGPITLTIAGNGGVPQEVSSHLVAVWKLVQKIAKLCQGQRIVTRNHLMPTLPEDVIVQHVSELKRITYMHSFEKLTSRIRNRFHGVFTVTEKVEKFFEAAPAST